MSRNALGRGLSALLSDSSPVPQPGTPTPTTGGPTQIPVERIRPNPYQPRQNIDPESIQELANSIKLHGLLQPIVVSYDSAEDEYELIAGERRLEATKHLEKIGLCLPGQIKLRIDLDSPIIRFYGLIPFLLSGKSLPFVQKAICFTRHLVGRAAREDL